MRGRGLAASRRGRARGRPGGLPLGRRAWSIQGRTVCGRMQKGGKEGGGLRLVGGSIGWVEDFGRGGRVCQPTTHECTNPRLQAW